VTAADPTVAPGEPSVYSHGLRFRTAQLFAGLALFGISISLLVRARLGLDPWDVLHQGLAQRTGIQIGWIVDIVGAIVVLAWIPLRQKPGFGTFANVALVGIVANAALAIVPAPAPLALRVILCGTGVALNGVATGLYIGAGLGPGPRDGLMTGLGRYGLSIRRARTMIELGVLATGFALGGSVGVGTVVYAVAIGPLADFFILRFAVGRRTRQGKAPARQNEQIARSRRGRRTSSMAQWLNRVVSRSFTSRTGHSMAGSVHPRARWGAADAESVADPSAVTKARCRELPA
jgi:uncharacterized membrane protein YczE